MPQFSLILPAAGRSTRFGGPFSKLFASLKGRPVLAWTLEAFAPRADIHEIVIACSDREAILDCAKDLEPAHQKKIVLCDGGDCRAKSVWAAAARSSPDSEWLAVHDAARPLASQSMIDRTFEAALKHGAAAAAMQVHLTIKQATGPLPAVVERTIPRESLWAMQTPQVMRRKDLLEAFEKCPMPVEQVTDDVQLLELSGKRVWLVQGEERNLKITTPQDLQIAEMLLQG